MAKFRKKPVVIEAIQLTRENVTTIATMEGVEVFSIEENYQPRLIARIKTLEGVMTASEGDWIITGVNGEKYPCKPDIFEKTYEPAESTETLEAGVVVVPTKLAKRVARELEVLAKAHEIHGFKRDAEELRAIISRLQQNGGADHD